MKRNSYVTPSEPIRITVTEHHSVRDVTRYGSGIWQPLKHPGRSILVTCCECGIGAPNNDQALRRAGWTESNGTPRRYRCGDCSAVTA
jgi:hypothetical protein